MTGKEMQRAVFLGTLRALFTFGGLVIIGAVLLRLVLAAIQY
jgi:hypothetical protein